MTPGTVVVATAVWSALLGLAALFAPDFLASLLGLEAGAQVPLQLFGAALFGFAALNWLGRSAVYGGIFGRPIVVANFMLGMIAGGTLLPAALGGRASGEAGFVAGVFLLQAAAFFWVMRRPPWGASQKAGGGSEPVR